MISNAFSTHGQRHCCHVTQEVPISYRSVSPYNYNAALRSASPTIAVHTTIDSTWTHDHSHTPERSKSVLPHKCMFCACVVVFHTTVVVTEIYRSLWSMPVDTTSQQGQSLEFFQVFLPRQIRPSEKGIIHKHFIGVLPRFSYESFGMHCFSSHSSAQLYACLQDHSNATKPREELVNQEAPSGQSLVVGTITGGAIQRRAN